MGSNFYRIGVAIWFYSKFKRVPYQEDKKLLMSTIDGSDNNFWIFKLLKLSIVSKVISIVFNLTEKNKHRLKYKNAPNNKAGHNFFEQLREKEKLLLLFFFLEERRA